MTDRQTNLLKLFQIDYSGASESESVTETYDKTIKITFEIEYRLIDTINISESAKTLRGRSISYLVKSLIDAVKGSKGTLKFLDSDIDTLTNCSSDLCNHPANYRVILERLFKVMKPLSERIRSKSEFLSTFVWSSFEDAYRNVIHCIDFPYYIIRNAGDVLLSDKDWVFSRELTSENFIKLLEFLNEHNGDSVSCIRTVTCHPGDILFLANPYRIPSYWASHYTKKYKYGCQENEIYVQKIYPNVKHLLGITELTPFYIWRLKQNVSCEIEIILTNIIGLTDSELNFTNDFSYQGHMLSPGIQDYYNSLDDLLQICDDLSFKSYASSYVDINWGKGLSYQTSARR